MTILLESYFLRLNFSRQNSSRLNFSRQKFRGVFESMSYFLAHPFLAQIAQIAAKQVGYFMAICN
jgi:hypothetical protein